MRKEKKRKEKKRKEKKRKEKKRKEKKRKEKKMRYCEEEIRSVESENKIKIIYLRSPFFQLLQIICQLVAHFRLFT
jgi:hypothetical protein